MPEDLFSGSASILFIVPLQKHMPTFMTVDHSLLSTACIRHHSQACTHAHAARSIEVHAHKSRHEHMLASFLRAATTPTAFVSN